MTEEAALELYKARWKQLQSAPLHDNKIDYFWSNNYKYFDDILSLEDFTKAIRLKNRKKSRRKRCHNKLENILVKYEELYFNKGIYCNLVFGTCTFNNESMAWKEETRTKKINKWIKEHFIIALANIDYGGKTEREHHHFIGLTFEEVEQVSGKGKKGYKMYELKNKNYDLGFEPTLEIIEDLENDRKLSNYLVKLNFHSNKKSTRNRRIRVLKNN